MKFEYDNVAMGFVLSKDKEESGNMIGNATVSFYYYVTVTCVCAFARSGVVISAEEALY